MMEVNRIYNEDCLTGLLHLPDKSVNCCVTSPPYYGLRDYGTGTWEGGSPDCNHSKKTSDKVGSSTMQSNSTNNNHEREGWKGGICGKCGAVNVDNQIGLELTPEAYVEKLVQVFREVKRVLRDDGTLWLNIGDSYWGGKGQSGQAWSTEHTDRDTLENHQHQISGKGETRPTDHKHDFIKPKDLIGIPWMVAFALRADGWYLRQDIIWHKPNPMPESVTDRCTKAHEYIFLLSKSKQYYYDAEAIKEQSIYAEEDYSNRVAGGERITEKISGFRPKDNAAIYPTRNKRSVWTVTTKPFSEAHFATFPEDLIAPMILAGCPEGGIVLDPFMGAGTTAVVARKLGRNYIGFELNQKYIDIAEKRIYNKIGLFL